jgi:glycosyltransferase involved in cell wall biosynthesis
VPLVATWHNAVLGGGPTRMLSAPLERLVARRAAVSLCVSPDLEHRVASLGGRDVRPALVSAPERPRTQRSRAAIRADLAAGDRPLVLTVARLHPQKGLHTLIDAADRLAGRSPAPLFAVAGDGPLRAELAARIEATGAPVSLLGHREDVADLLAACDLAVLPSVWEGSPLAAQESLRAGVPLIGTRVGGVAALVGDAGLLVPPDDDVALADAIGAVLDDPALAADLARKARDAAQRLPSDESVVAEVAAIYAELLEAPRH